MNGTVTADLSTLVGHEIEATTEDTVRAIAPAIDADALRDTLIVVTFAGEPSGDLWTLTGVSMVDPDQAYGGVIEDLATVVLAERDAHPVRWFALVRGGGFVSPQGFIPGEPTDADIDVHNDTIDALARRLGYDPASFATGALDADQVPVFSDVIIRDLEEDVWYSTAQLVADPLGVVFGPRPLAL